MFLKIPTEFAVGTRVRGGPKVSEPGERQLASTSAFSGTLMSLTHLCLQHQRMWDQGPACFSWVGSSGHWVCGSFIIASEQLGLKKKIEILVLAPSLCVETKWA